MFIQSLIYHCLSYLNRVGSNLLQFKGVDHPHSDIAYQEESDYLPSWLATVMFWQMNAATRNISNEEKLQDHLSKKRKIG